MWVFCVLDAARVQLLPPCDTALVGFDGIGGSAVGRAHLVTATSSLLVRDCSDITTTTTTTSALRPSPQAVTTAGCFRLSHYAAVPTRQHITSSSSAHPRHAHGLAWRLNRLAGLHSRMLRKQAHRHCRIRITSARPHNHRQMPTSLRYALGCRRSSTMPILTPARVRHSRPHPTRPVITTASQILSQALLHSSAPISLSHPQRLARRNPDANRQEAP